MAGHAPRRTRRWGAVVVAGAFVLLTVAASLSDRVPSAMSRATSRLGQLGRAVEQRLDIDVVNRDDIPWSAMQLAHLLGWFGGMVLFGLMARRRWSPAAIAIALFAFGGVVEVGQARFSQVRTFELDDLAMNAIGILVGLGVVVTCDRLPWFADRERSTS